MARVSVPYWTVDELEARRQHEIEQFVAQWDQTMGARHRELYEVAKRDVEELFEASENLKALKENPKFFDRRKNRRLLAAARALTAPYLSEDNFPVVARVLGRTATIKDMLDGLRVPWVDEEREPTADELDFAIRSTAGQMAMRRHDTERRTTSSKTQEALARKELDTAGLTFVERAEVEKRLQGASDYDPAQGIEVDNLDIALNRGEFTSEFLCAGTKCDLPIRTTRGTFFALEAKVSNSSSNTTKRLIREVCGKVGPWRREFGERTLVGGFMAGVFSLKNLRDAQADDVLLFFQHESETLGEFVAANWRPRPRP
jgi:hypothetical protein